MTVHTLHPHLSNGKQRPTVSNPVLKTDTVKLALNSLDEHIRLLRCAADSAALDNEGLAQDELTEALYFLHKKLRWECDRLISLL